MASAGLRRSANGAFHNAAAPGRSLDRAPVPAEFLFGGRDAAIVETELGIQETRTGDIGSTHRARFRTLLASSGRSSIEERNPA